MKWNTTAGGNKYADAVWVINSGCKWQHFRKSWTDFVKEHNVECDVIEKGQVYTLFSYYLYYFPQI